MGHDPGGTQVAPSQDVHGGLPDSRPDDPTHFSLVVQAFVGNAEEQGDELFRFTVCTPSHLAPETRFERGFEFLRQVLLVAWWGAAMVARAISGLVRTTSGAGWNEFALNLSCYGYWEFEDYQEFTP
jgi:Immunity protein 8